MELPAKSFSIDLIKFSDEALDTIESFDEVEQQIIASDLTKCFKETMTALYDMQVQSYWTHAQTYILNLLTNEFFPISIGCYSLRVAAEVCHVSGQMYWHIHDVKKYQHDNVIKLSDIKKD